MRRLQIQIQPRISPEMKVLLDSACKERKMPQGEIIDAALEAFLNPGEKTQTQYEVILMALQGIRELMLEERVQAPIEFPPMPEEIRTEQPPVAEHEQMYGPMQAWLPPHENGSVPEHFRQQPKRSFWARLFLKNERV